MFSAVIPLHDKRPWIGRALGSIAAQEFPCAEIVVVNDGSTDGGDAEARAWGDPRIRVVDQPRRGVSAARNAGIAAATQPFVAFLDADDEWLPGFLARMKSLVGAHPGAVLYGSGFAVVVDGREVRRHGAVTAGPAGGPVDFFREIARDQVVHQSGTVVPRAAALAVGGFPEGVPCFEDQIFWLKLAVTGPVVLAPEPLVRYDMSVPGQALAAWRQRQARSFDATDLDRFLAGKLRERPERPATTPAAAAFVAHARRHLARAALQRAYWGRFDALARFWSDLRLDDVRLGWPATAAAWAARHPAVQPGLRGGLAVVRGVRRAVLRRLPRPPA